jgi:hypothetical protein
MSRKLTYYGSKQSASPLLANLVAWYKFDNNFNDSTPNAHNGAGTGSPTFVSGVIGDAVNFDNTNTLRYVQVPDADGFSFTDGITDLPFTITMWVYHLSFSSAGNFYINKRSTDVSPNIEWQFYYISSANAIQVLLFDGNNTTWIGMRSSVNPFALNTWYHIAATYDGSGLASGIKLYLNGVDVSTTTILSGTYVGMNNTAAPIRMGNAGWATTTVTKHRGYLDMLGVWKNRELTAAEILMLYNSGTGLDYPF